MGNLQHSRGGLRAASAIVAAAFACFGCSAAPASTPPSLRELVEAADISSISASPDARLVAFRVDRASVESNSYSLGWHIAELETGRVREIGSAGEPILDDPGLLAAEPPIWSPDGRWIYYRSLRSGAVQIWRSAVDGSEAEAVTAEAGDVLSLEAAPGGGSILYRVGPPRAEIERAELEEYDSGILVDAHVELGQNVFRGALVHGRRATQRLTGPWFSRGNVLWERPERQRRLDLATLEVTDEAGGEGTAPETPGARPVATAVAAKGDVASASWKDKAGSIEVVRKDGGTVSCAAALCRTGRIVWLAWRPGQDQLLFAVSDLADVQSLPLWDLGSGKLREVRRGAGFLNGGRQERWPCAVASEEAVCVLAEPNGPPRLERIDLASGRSRLLHDPNWSLRLRPWPRAERIAWRSPEGREFNGVLFLPERKTGGKQPLFINYYRCSGYIRGGVGDEWPFAALASSGIASACINTTRNAGEQEGVGQYRWALAGIETLVARLEARGLVDRARVGMGGLSFGSEVTLWTLMYSDLLAAASIASPSFEPATYWLNNMKGRRHRDVLRKVWGLGSPDETPEQWRLLSPALNTERIRAPLLLQTSEQESRYGIEFYGRLSNSATPTELYVFPEEPHLKVQPRHRLSVYRRNLDWFRFWLQDFIDPDPAKAEQYRRWTAMAEAQKADQLARSEARARSKRGRKSGNRTRREAAGNGEIGLERAAVEQSEPCKLAVEQKLGEPPAIVGIGPGRHAFEPALGAPADDLAGKKVREGDARHRPIAAAAGPEPARDGQAELDQRLVEERVVNRLARAIFGLDEVLGADQRFHMLDRSGRSPSWDCSEPRVRLRLGKSRFGVEETKVLLPAGAAAPAELLSNSEAARLPDRAFAERRHVPDRLEKPAGTPVGGRIEDRRGGRQVAEEVVAARTRDEVGPAAGSGMAGERALERLENRA